MRVVRRSWRALSARVAAVPGSRRARIAAAVLVVAGVGLGVQVATQVSAPANNGQLRCGSNNRVLVNHTCTLVFVDGGPRSGYGATPPNGHKVCFSTAAPNVVAGANGKCTATDSQATANGTFTAKGAGTFKVTAAESFHSTSEGSVSISVTVPAPPGRPRGVSAFPSGDQQAALFWHAPTSGASTITAYVVKPFLGDVAQPVHVFKSTKTTANITGLTDGSTYRFEVAARSRAGTGAFSAPSAGMIAGAPGQPSGTQAARVAPGKLQVSFKPPGNNGAPITSYHARCVSSDGGKLGHLNGTRSPITVRDLTPGKTYACTVSATNSRGRGPVSRPSAAVTA